MQRMGVGAGGAKEGRGGIWSRAKTECTSHMLVLPQRAPRVIVLFFDMVASKSCSLTRRGMLQTPGIHLIVIKKHSNCVTEFRFGLVLQIPVAVVEIASLMHRSLVTV